MSLEIEKKDIEFEYTSLSFSSVPPSFDIVGQEKALGLLRLGLSMSRPGYNIFVSGDDGSGRLTAIRKEIAQIEGDTSLLRDVAYLYNHSHPECPICFVFQKGGAREFQSDLDSLREGKTDREALCLKWKDSRLVKFIKTLPPESEDKWAWRINIVLDRGKSIRRPLVIEAHPSRQSLFGYMEKDLPPHMAVRIGSYQEAAGGFLVLDAGEAAGDEELWTTLNRYLDMTMRSMDSTAVKGE
ncbi:MAG: AAA family ATPase, partial [Candidatus Ornithospirochaeta sp.]